MSNILQEKQQKFMGLYEPCHARLSRYIRSMVWDEHEAKDLMSETVLIAYEKLDDLKKPDAFVYFLFAIAKRLISNKYRKEDRTNHITEIEEPTSIAMEVEDKLRISDLYKAMQMLPVEQCEALTLYEISGFSIAEIKEMQNVSLSAVKSRIARGRQRLAEILRAEEASINKLFV